MLLNTQFNNIAFKAGGGKAGQTWIFVVTTTWNLDEEGRDSFGKAAVCLLSSSSLVEVQPEEVDGGGEQQEG